MTPYYSWLYTQWQSSWKWSPRTCRSSCWAFDNYSGLQTRQAQANSQGRTQHPMRTLHVILRLKVGNCASECISIKHRTHTVHAWNNESKEPTSLSNHWSDHWAHTSRPSHANQGMLNWESGSRLYYPCTEGLKKDYHGFGACLDYRISSGLKGKALSLKTFF